MTLEEAIQVINEHIVHWKHLKVNGCAEPSEAKRTLEAFDMAIEALQTETCEDCISRQVVINTIFAECSCTKLDIDFAKFLLLRRAIKALPSVQPKQKTGYWIDTGSGQECSLCGEIQYGYDNFRRFCASCGAKMEVECENS